MDQDQVWTALAKKELPNPFADEIQSLRSMPSRTSNEQSRLERLTAFDARFIQVMPSYKSAVASANWKAASEIANALLEEARAV